MKQMEIFESLKLLIKKKLKKRFIKKTQLKYNSSLNKKIENIGKKIPDHTNIYLLQNLKVF